MTCECISGTPFGRLRHAGCERLHRHQHNAGFAAIVLAGSYLEAGDRGRIPVGPGDVIFHEPFEAHLDDVGTAGAQVLVLPWNQQASSPLGTVADPDEIMLLAERDLPAAVRLLKMTVRPRPIPIHDWPDRLAAHLRHDSSAALERWAMDAGLRPETVSRGFRRAFGITPARFRERCRTLNALVCLSSSQPLAEIAAACGFSDQAHLTRSVRNVTGATPTRLRAGPA